MNKGISTTGVPNKRYPITTGYVILPNNIARDVYIARCLRTHMLGVYGENGEVVWNVRISNNLVNAIQFPDQAGNLGSQVIMGNIANHNKPVIIGILNKNDESDWLIEDQFHVRKTSDLGTVEIVGDARNNILSLNVDSLRRKGGHIQVLLSNSEDQGLLTMSVDGNIEIQASKTVKIDAGEAIELVIEDVDSDVSATIKYVAGTGLTITDEFGNTFVMKDGAIQSSASSQTVSAENDITLEANIVSLGGEGGQPIVLGNALLQELVTLNNRIQLLYTAINAAVPLPGDGGLQFKAQLVAAIASGNTPQTFSTILSNVVSSQ